MKNIIMFDIDNTLFDHYKHEVPASTIKALKLLQKHDNLIGLASGKYPQYIETFLKPFGINITTYVAFNGNYVVYQNQLIYDNPLPPALTIKFEKYCLKNNLPFVYVTTAGVLTKFWHNEIIAAYYNYFSNTTTVKPVSSVDYPRIYQLSVMISKENEQQIISLFPEFAFIRINPFGMNVVLNDGLKEKGLKKILAYAQIDSTKLIAFGDDLNDIGMLKLAHIGVALGNAAEEVKEVATFCADHISDDGIYKACQALKLF